MAEALQSNNAELQNTVDKMKLTFQEVEAQVSDLKRDLKKSAKQYEEA